MSASRMPALTLRQPWAFCIAHGAKRIENRGWKPPEWLGQVAIHAGAMSGWDSNADGSRLVRQAITDYRDQIGAVPGLSAAGIMDFGAVVAVADLTGSHLGGSPVLAFTRAGRQCTAADPCSPWSVPGEVHWELDNVRALASPVPCRGAQRIWYLPEDVAAAVRAQLPLTTPGPEGPGFPRSPSGVPVSLAAAAGLPR